MLYHELVDAVIRAAGAAKTDRTIPYMSRADGMLLSKALQLLGTLMNEFHSIAPDPTDYDKQITAEAELIRKKMKEQVALIEGIIERTEAR